MVKYAILGPIELCDGERRRSAGGPRQLALLAFLLVHANRAVSSDRLIDALIGGQRHDGALKRLQVAIARLRQTLAVDGAGGEPALRTVAGGYLLGVASGDLDADVFQARVEDGRRALREGEERRAAAVLREALGLWRGPPLAEVGYEEWARDEIRRLEELRLAALEARVDADLRVGGHAALVGELEALVAGHPARERLTEQLMLTLYRCGRQAEALDAYRRTRTYLAAELGLEPGSALKELQAKIFEQSASLDVAAPEARTSPGAHRPAAGLPIPDGALRTPPDARRPDGRRLVCVLAARVDVDDPEALHGLFNRCARVIERHGGTVERFLGDALVGFFGLTESHGDDALCAARAAVALRGATDRLRLGIELGRVFLAEGPRGATIATGAAISAAGRLAERAAEGEIVLGEEMRRAVAADARVDADGRLLELRADEPALLRAPATPFVGRARELGELHAAFAQARDDRVCRLVTVAGPPGIGKSRLAREFLAAVDDGATVLAGRCLAHGEGTAYHALRDIVRALGSDVRAGNEDLAQDEEVLRGIHGAIGLTDEPARMEETSWALRRLLERLGRERPVVVAVEDIHWAEPALLDLLDHVVTLSSGSPIMIVCLTRPELLESRPAWGAPQPNRRVLVLEALPDPQARELAECLGAEGRAGRIADRAEGNPLFVEQLVAVGAGHDDGCLPASIQAVLAARIDRLGDDERMLLQRAAVEGRTFHVGMLATLLPEDQRNTMSSVLVALARKGLIGADRPDLAGEDAFRFTHALIREAAYQGLSKLLRARLHAGVAEWLEARQAAMDEIVGFHLEQACHLRAELGVGGELDRERAARAMDRFGAASRSALARGDPAAASALLQRAIALVQGDSAARCALLPALGAALFEAGSMTEAEAVLDDAVAHAHEPRIRARALVEREFVRLATQAGVGTEQARRVAEEALPLLEREGDDGGQSRAWCLLAMVRWNAGSVGGADEAWCRGAELARRSGDERQLHDTVMRRASAAVFGPTPVDEAIRRCEEIRELVRGGPVAVTATMHALASLHAMNREFARARELLREANHTRRKLGDVGSSVSHHEALVEMLAGRPAHAEARLRSDLARLERLGDRGILATTTAMLAQAVYAQGRPHEAESLCRATERSAAADDIVTQVVWRGVQARIAADTGRYDHGRRLAEEAVALVRCTDMLTHHGDALLDLAHVLRAGAQMYHDVVRSALALYDRKGNVASSARATSMFSL